MSINDSSINKDSDIVYVDSDGDFLRPHGRHSQTDHLNISILINNHCFAIENQK
uniref:Uncharacterized protein n=1 Tax=Oryza brachyantha TaxID=4533 RepID=J3KYC4_ORYBR